jgi:branched-chain amino acid transport system substrate-binding protein
MDKKRTRSRRRSALTLLAAAAPLAVLATACSSSAQNSSSSGSSPAQGASAAAHLTGAPIKVGEIVEIQGVGLNWSFQKSVDEAAVLGINSRGGINGRPLQLEVCDGQNGPNTEIQCARNLVSDGVVAVVGGIVVNSGAAVDAFFLAHNIAEIGVDPLVTSDFTLANQFPLTAGQLGIFSGTTYNGVTHGVKQIWQMNLDIAGASLAEQVTADTAAANGSKAAGLSVVPLTSTNDASYVQAAVSSGSDGVLAAMGAAQTATLLLALNQSGQKLTLMNLDTEPSDQLTAACGAGGGVCAGSLGSSSSLAPTDTSNAGVRLFQQDMEAEAATGDSSAKPLAAYNDMATEGWLGMEALAKVLKTLPTVTAKSVLNGFDSAKNINLWGMIPNWTPDASAGIPGYPRISNPYVYLTELHSDLLPYITSTTPYNILKLDPKLAAQ